MGHKMIFLQVLLGFFAAFSNALPSDVTFCSRSKCSGSTRFRYEPMTSYLYRYNADVAALIDGSDRQAQESRIHLMTNVRIDLHSECDWTLRLYNTTLQDSNPLDESVKATMAGEQDFRTLLEQFELRLSFEDGIVSAICPAKGDPAWSVNIKRGILSTMQNTMPRFDLDAYRARESDVTGTCDVVYSFDSVEGNRIKVSKTRDLSSCSDRHNIAKSITSAVPYHFPGDYDSMPLMDSSSSCKQSIVTGRLVYSECHERHVVKPFSHDHSGAVTTSRQTLEFIESVAMEQGSKPASDASATVGRQSLLYQHKSVADNDANESNPAYSILHVLRNLCENTAFGVTNEAAELFGSLTHLLSTSYFKYESLVELLSRSDDLCRDGNAARRLLLNGLISVGSSDAFAVIADEITAGRMEPDLVNRWTTSLSSASRLSSKHLEAILPLMDLPVASRPQRLGLRISSMVKKLCSNQECDQLLHVSIFVGKLSQTLVNSCQTRSREEREEVVMSLKSLANVGAAFTSSHVDTLESCFEEKDNPAEVRIAALQGLSNVKCNMKGNAAMKILADVTEDTEIRIAAYLAVMKCPDFQTILNMKNLLVNEEMNQVGSFIWTHLENLAQTSLPSKASVQALVVDQDLVNKFSSDVRKFSKNLEYSVFFDEINAGGSLESNVVFSQHSYLPRSTWLNFTVDVFGKSINVLEMEGRMEGFERYIESLFQSGGIYEQDGVSSVLRSLRPKRRAHPPGLNAEKLKAMDEQFDAASHFRDEPQMSLSMKVLGKELGYGHWEGSDEIKRSISQLNPVTSIQRLLNGEEMSYTYAGRVLDAAYVIPLASGFPLRLEGRANVVADVRGSVSADLSSFFSKASAHLTWKMHPSVAANFEASLTVDALFIKAGVKLVTNMHSSVSTSGSFNLEGFKLVDLRIDFPQKEADIIKFKSETQLIHSYPDSKVIPLSGISERVEYSSCTRGDMLRFLGLKICAEVSYANGSTTPNAGYFPLTGPADFHINLVKVDQSVTSYRFLHQIENEELLKSWKLTFQPGYDELKEIGIKTFVQFTEFDSGDMALSLKLPDKNYEIKGSYTWDDEEANERLKRSDGSKWPTYRPRLTLSYLDRKLVDLHGSVRTKTADGNVQCNLDIDAAIGSWKTSTTGYYLIADNSYVSNLTVEYRSPSSRRTENVKLEVKLDDEAGEDQLRQWDVHLGVEWSASPDSNFVGTWKMKQSRGQLDNVATFNRGATSRDSHYTLTLAQSFIFQISPEIHRLRNRMHVTLPSRGIDLEFAINHLHSNFIMDSFFLARYAPQKEIQCGLLLQKEPGVLLQANGAFNLTLPSQSPIGIRGKLQETVKDTFKVDMDGAWGSGSDFVLSGLYEQRHDSFVSSQDLNIEVTGSMMYPMEITYFWQNNNTLFEAQLQTSYGEDSVSWHISRDRPSRDEVKIGTKIGYGNYFHTVELYLNNRVDQIRAAMDIHVDKVMDLRGEFSRAVDRSSGRRDTSVEFSWNANRNPLQKMVLRTLLEPSLMNPNDWNALIQFNYPGTFLKCNLAALTQRDERLITGTIDFGSKGTVIVSSRSYFRNDAILTELIVETPFDGYKQNKALFTSKTDNGRHRTALIASWASKSFLEMELKASRISDGLESAEAILSCKSSFQQLELFKIVAKSELDFNTLDSKATVEWGTNGDLIEMVSNLEWAFDDHVTVKSDTTLTTPFKSLSTANVQLHQTIEWDLANVFETKLAIAVNNLIYDTIIKVERPTVNERWELTALMNTPHPQYRKMGVSTMGVVTETRSSIDANVYWPEKDASLSLAVIHVQPGEVRAKFQVQAPVEKLSRLSIEGGYIFPESLTEMQLDVATNWNEEDYIKLNASMALGREGMSGGKFLASLDTSFDESDHYATAAGYFTSDDEFEAFAQLQIPDFKVGVNGKMLETETDEGELTTGNVVLELTGYPVIQLNYDQMNSTEVARYINVELRHGDQSATLRQEDRMEGDVWVNQLKVSSVDFDMADAQVTMRYRNHMTKSEPEKEVSFDADEDEDGGMGGWGNEEEDYGSFASQESLVKENEFLVSLVAVWGQPDQDEDKAELLIHVTDSAEEKEDFTTETKFKYEFAVHSPLEVVRQLSARVAYLNDDVNMQPSLHVVYNDDSVGISGVVNLPASESTMTMNYTSAEHPHGVSGQMKSTWSLGDDGITVEGTLETEMDDLQLVNWKLSHVKTDDEDGRNEKVQLDVELDLDRAMSAVLDLTATQVSATLETPFDGWEHVSVNCEYETDDDRTNVNAKINVHDDEYQAAGFWVWPEEYFLMEEMKLMVNAPQLDKEILLLLNSDVMKETMAGKMTAKVEVGEYSINSDAEFDLNSETPKMNASVSVTDHLAPENVHYAARVVFDVPEVTDISGQVMLVAPSLISQPVVLETQLHKDDQGNLKSASSFRVPAINGRVSVSMDDRDDSLAADLGLNYGDYMLKANGTLKSGLSDILLDVSGRWPTGYSTKTLASSLELKDRSKVAFHTVSFMEIISFEEAEFEDEFEDMYDEEESEVKMDKVERVGTVEEVGRWSLDVQLDARDWENDYSHKITYTPVKESYQQEAESYGSTAKMVTDGPKRKGHFRIKWPELDPIGVEFTLETRKQLEGSAKVLLRTPWTSFQPSLSLNVDVNANSLPAIVQVKAEGPAKSVVIDVDAAVDPALSIAVKANVKTVYSWLPKAGLELSHASTAESFNGSYAFQWADKHSVGIHLFDEEQPNGVNPLAPFNITRNFKVNTSLKRLPEVSVSYSRGSSSPTDTETVVKIGHNGTTVFHSVSQSTLESSAGLELSKWTLQLVQGMRSGIEYQRRFEYSGGHDGSNLPTTLTRTVELFRIDQRQKNMFQGELTQKQTSSGEEYGIKLTSPIFVRTVELSTYVDFPDGVFKHGSQFRWNSNEEDRIGYEIHIENRTTEATSHYVMTASLETPVRGMALTGTMKAHENDLRALAEIVWDLKRSESVAIVDIDWRDVSDAYPVTSDRIQMRFRRGTLPEELSVVSLVHRGAGHPFSIHTEVQYCNEPERNVFIDFVAASGAGHFRTEMNVTHPVTQLEMRHVVSFAKTNATAQVIHSFSHQCSGSDLLVVEHLASVDMAERKVYLSATSNKWPWLSIRHQGHLTSMNGTHVMVYETRFNDRIQEVVELQVDRNLPLAHLRLTHFSNSDTSAHQSVHLRAGIPDKRQAILEWYRMDNDQRIRYFDFFFRLNHSRLITTETHWNTNLRRELIQRVAAARSAARSKLQRWVVSFAQPALEQAKVSMRAISQDIARVLKGALLNFDEEMQLLKIDYGRMERYVEDGYDANAFFIKVIRDLGGKIIKGIPFRKYAGEAYIYIEQTGNRALKPLTQETDSFTRLLEAIQQQLDKVSRVMTQWLDKQWASSSTRPSHHLSEKINEIFMDLAVEYDRIVKDIQLCLEEILAEISSSLRLVASDVSKGIYQTVQPIVLQVYVSTEAAVWGVVKELLDYFYDQREALVDSSYFQKLSQLIADLKQFYVDLGDADVMSKMGQHLRDAASFLRVKYSQLHELVQVIDDARQHLANIYSAFLEENPELQKGADAWRRSAEFIQWSYNYADVSRRLSDVIDYLRRRGSELMQQSATDAYMRHLEPKTRFSYEPESGSILLEQKLPFSWISFDELPRFEEIQEVQMLRSVVQLFEPSNKSLSDTLTSYVPNMDVADWLPPFKGTAQIIGLQHVLTFDGRYLEFAGPCTYLLARDFLTHHFTLAIHYLDTRGKPYAAVLQLVIDGVEWSLDLSDEMVRVAGQNRLLPAEEHGTVAYYDDRGNFNIHSPAKGVLLQCVANYHVCTLTLSGWYNNKVAGLFGTMDNEPMTDTIRPNRVIEKDLTAMARSWDVSVSESCKTTRNLARKVAAVSDPNTSRLCSSFFASSTSTMKSCFSVVDASPYHHMCMVPNRNSGMEAGCQAAVAYVQACAAKSIRVRVPPNCVKCQLEGGEDLLEGQSKQFLQESSPRSSTDVVILFELGECNRDGRNRTFLPSLLTNLERELNANRLTKNRYSLVLFGGRAPYDVARVRTFRGNHFVTPKELRQILEDLPAVATESGSADVLGAMRSAMALNFRAGVSKTFILVPCSSCGGSPSIQAGYKLSAHALLEQDVTLHIIADHQFQFTKARAYRQFLGLDAATGYTLKDNKGGLVGDVDLRRQAKLSRSALGLCAPLALETNGTIFDASRMRPVQKKSSESKRAINVFVKRVAATAQPADCHNCVCSLVNYHQSWTDCRLCTAPSVPDVDLTFLSEPWEEQRNARVSDQKKKKTN